MRIDGSMFGSKENGKTFLMRVIDEIKAAHDFGKMSDDTRFDLLRSEIDDAMYCEFERSPQTMLDVFALLADDTDTDKEMHREWLARVLMNGVVEAVAEGVNDATCLGEDWVLLA